jgi:GTP-binding protein
MQDRAKIFVQAGAGGNGAVSFRREAHVPKGGPDGGDGGRGADVVLVCDESLRDLQPFRRRLHFKAPRGGHGEGGERHGASPAELAIPVPPGTVVEEVTGRGEGAAASGMDGGAGSTGGGLRFDLTRPGQRAVVARGGSGGRGNTRFKSSTRQAPRFAERGLPGEERWLELRLKLLADAGLIGLPNAGKSSLLARLTRAHPKVADYPFTTLEPVLGTLEGPERQLVVADIPGLIEGASGGAGLGHEFLAHVERTRLLVHVLDLAPLDGSDPVANHATVEAELRGYGHGLAELPRILALSKADLVPAEAAESATAEWRARLPDALAVIVTSAATGQGLDELGRELLRHVPAHTAEPALPGGDEPLAEHKVYRPADDDGFRVERGSDGVLRVSGPAVERLLARHDVDNEEALRYVEDRLRRIGVIRALEQAGFEPGDDVELAGRVFELDPGAPFR